MLVAQNSVFHSSGTKRDKKGRRRVVEREGCSQVDHRAAVACRERERAAQGGPEPHILLAQHGAMTDGAWVSEALLSPEPHELLAQHSAMTNCRSVRHCFFQKPSLSLSLFSLSLSLSLYLSRTFTNFSLSQS